MRLPTSFHPTLLLLFLAALGLDAYMHRGSVRGRAFGYRPARARHWGQDMQFNVVTAPLGATVVEVSDGAVDRRTSVVNRLRNVVDPDAGDDVVSAGRVGNVVVTEGGDVAFVLAVENLKSPLNDEMKRLCRAEIAALPWAKEVTISLVDVATIPRAPATAPSSPPPPTPPVAAAPQPTIGVPTAQVSGGMAGVKHVIAVSSCKGGVGKSTVSVNLAYTLQRAGAKVGILDADIYGPSLPTMTKPAATDVVFANNQLKPLEFEGVKLMSMGFINKGAAIMRGPMVNQILNQFVSLCNWGDLDYLVIDMPPGTGDIQLTLAQIMNISAAVIVTTPQRLSFVDVVKGIDLFDTVNVPCVAVVENMCEYEAYTFPPGFYEALGAKAASAAAASLAFNPDPSRSFDAVTRVIRDAVEAQKQPRKVFGQGHNARLRDMWGIDNIVSIPLLDDVAASGDSGLPHVVKYPESAVAASLAELAQGVVTELKRLSDAAGAGGPQLTVDRATNELVYQGTSRVAAKTLRMDCRCAVCVEEFTGRRLLAPASVPDDVQPLSSAPIGRYAVSVDWSDGHKSLFPFRQIAALVQQGQ